MPNISNPTVSQEALMFSQTMPQLVAAIQDNQKQQIKSNNNAGGRESGMSGFMQPQTDHYASIYAPLHLQRLGVS